MECYQTISYSRNSRNINNNTPHSSSSAQHLSSFPSEKLTDLPITIGTYLLDGEDKNKMIAQLLLSELSKVGKLVESFASRCNEQSGGAPNEAKGELCLTLTAFLRFRLRAAIGVVMEDLKGN